MTKPEDILPDEVDSKQIEGIHIRKGTVAAFLANATILNQTESTLEEKTKAQTEIEKLAPALVALKFHEHVTWKNDTIQRIMEKAVKSVYG